MRRGIDETGNRYGRLIVIEETGRSPNGSILWRCLCDCGNEAIVLGTNLRYGVTKSCGCISRQTGEKSLQWRGGDALSKCRWNLKKDFGISLIEYDEMLESQGNRCAICGVTPEKNGKRLCVDHDHNTGRIRELLCHQCNLMLGNSREDIDLMLKAIGYLRKHR